VANRSEGEEAFAQAFHFLPFVPAVDHEVLRDFLYKFAHNYDEAKEHLQLLKQLDELDADNKSELLFRVQGMALQSFALDMRRMTDNISKRGMQAFVTKVARDEFKAEELNKIKAIHDHYKRFLNKGTVHQDKQSKHETLAAFPDTNVIDADMQYLKELYNKLTKELCSAYIGIDGTPYDYGAELNKLKLTDNETSFQN
jgi:hypothetical protein